MTALHKTLAFLSGGALVLLLTLYATTSQVPPVHARAQFASAQTAIEAADISAQAAIIYDVTTHGILFSKNERAQLPLASLIKVPLVLTVRNVLNATDPILISEAALEAEGDSGLVAGDVWKAETLSDFTLVSSSNDGALALAEAAGPLIRARYNTSAQSDPVVWRMNTLFSELGLSETYAVNVTGLDVSTTLSGAYGSAYDMARLFAYVIARNQNLLEATAHNDLLVQSETGNDYSAANTNDALGKVPGLMGGKTGFTDLAGGNLVTVFDAGLNHPIIIVVLGSTREGRFEDTRVLVDATLKYFSDLE